MAKRKIKANDFTLVSIVACIVAVFIVMNQHGGKNSASSKPTNVTNSSVSTENARVYFLDVGQGDSELILLPNGKNVLIDAATSNSGDALCKYIKNLGVSKIDYLIATHPHEDHIGGMDDVVKSFDIGKIYMPKIADSQVPTTKTYEKLLDAIKNKGLKITQAKGGMTIFDEDKAKLEIFAPNSAKYSELNSYSVVTKFSYGKNRVLITGDAEIDSEKEMIHQGYDLQCEVLKCGHHGSSTSTATAFLKAVKPKAAIISCGVNNDYGHPHKETLEKLKKMNIPVYRTDEQKTILATCSEDNITISSNEKSVIR